MENILDKKESKLVKQLGFLENQKKNFLETFWRVGFKMIHDDPSACLDTLFQVYFPSREEISQKFEEERERLIKERSNLTKECMEEKLQKFTRGLDNVSMLNEMIHGESPIFRKQRSIYSDCDSLKRNPLKNDKKDTPEMVLEDLQEESDTLSQTSSKAQSECIQWRDVLAGYQSNPQRDPKSPEKSESPLKKSESRISVPDRSPKIQNCNLKCRCDCHGVGVQGKKEEPDFYTVGFLNHGEKIEIHIQKSKVDVPETAQVEDY